jgi:predicted metal-dependent HD superfamily phosphohydrolase
MALEHLAGYIYWHKTAKLVKWHLLPKWKIIGYNWNATQKFYMENLSDAYLKGRYYHTVRHINYMINHVKDFKLTKKEQAKLELAIWFHDIVYDAQKTDNEKNSGIKLVHFGESIGIRLKDINEMTDLILDTKHNITPTTKLGKIICDLDLREFVSDRQKLNTPEVRKEYSHLSDEEFNKGRVEFLKTMLKKTHIYHTKLYRDLFENKARENLTNELNNIANEG